MNTKESTTNKPSSNGNGNGSNNNKKNGKPITGITGVKGENAKQEKLGCILNPNEFFP